MPLKKNTILIIIIVLALGGAIYVLYNAFVSSGPSPAPSPLVVNANDATAGSVLPFGKRLDFEALKKYNPDGKLFNYPVVSPAEVGPALGQIIKPDQP